MNDPLGDREFTWDPELICRVFTNLLSNALEAAPRRGEVSLTATAKTDSGGVTVEIIDNGPGFHPDIKERLFKPFFTTKEGGTGLGLANVKKMVELHGGSVSAANRKNGGARFSVYLPEGAAI